VSLHHELSRFDGKGLAVLEAILANTAVSTEVLDTLVAIVDGEDAHRQTGASWLLRAYLQEGAALEAKQVSRLASALAGMHDGFGRLHVCQAMDDITVPPAHAEFFADFFRSCASSKNTFLRAWAPHGFFQLALAHERYADDARAMVEKALTDAAPSVRARARRTLTGE
jgi:hypothetical protein